MFFLKDGYTKNKIRLKVKFYFLWAVVILPLIITLLLFIGLLTFTVSHFVEYVFKFDIDAFLNKHEILFIIYSIFIVNTSGIFLVFLCEKSKNSFIRKFIDEKGEKIEDELRHLEVLKDLEEETEALKKKKEIFDKDEEIKKLRESMQPKKTRTPPQESEENATKPEAFAGNFNDFEDDILSPEDDEPKRHTGHRKEEPEEPHYESESDRLKDIIRKRTE